MATVADRSNDAWVESLRGPGRDQSLDDLRERLLRGLRFALKQRYHVTELDLEDFVQDALVKVLDNLDSFRGESRFITWAQKIAIRVAFSELRRKRWENIALQDLVPDTPSNDAANESSPLSWLPSAELTPEHRVTQQDLRALLASLIQQELTDLQRRALVAVVLHEMPIEEVARRMSSNRNALYKLLHDARQRLKVRMEAQGVSVDEVLADFATE